MSAPSSVTSASPTALVSASRPSPSAPSSATWSVRHLRHHHPGHLRRHHPRRPRHLRHVQHQPRSSPQQLVLSDSTSITPPPSRSPSTPSQRPVRTTHGDHTFGVPSVSLGTILGDLGINTMRVSTRSHSSPYLVGNPKVNLGLTSISLSTFLDDAGLNKDSISLNTIFGDLGLNTSASFTPAPLSVPVDTILSTWASPTPWRSHVRRPLHQPRQHPGRPRP